MKAKAFGLLLLLPIAASAQVSYDYTSGPITSVQIFGSGGPAPALGTGITGVITLAQALPENGTSQNIVPVSTSFQSALGPLFVTNSPSGGDVVSYSFTTSNGVITSFGWRADTFPSGFAQTDFDAFPVQGNPSNTLSYATGADFVGGYSFTASEGSVNLVGGGGGGGVHGAPEIDPTSVGAALTILGGALVMLRGRRRRVG